VTSSVTEAIVLKNTNYRDADRLYTLFTRELGKVSAVARGVRKITSKRSGNLDTLNLVTVKLVKDSRGYYAVDEVKTINSYKNVKRDLELLKKGYYVLEFIHRLVEESHPFDELFDVTKKTLSLLASPSFAPDLSINFFEIKFLSLMGYEMSLTKCIVCERSYNSSAQNWVNSRFSYALGGLVCDDCSSRF
jgi:DNA repair protein RecO (recombination protein O)